MANSSENVLAEISKMKVPDLKKECKARNLPTTGTKKDLVQRLKAEISQGSVDDTVEEEVDADAADDSVEDALDQVLGEDDTDEIALTTEAEAAPKESVSDVKTPITAPVSDSKPTVGVSETDRLKMRVQKFGAINPDLQKQMRAERFGISQGNVKGGNKIASAPPADMDKLKKRAERFGTVTSTVLSKVDETQKLKKRAERFGAVPQLVFPM
ncbi:SAP domain-containing ribonucleoprotein-like [Argopecten irradians]|uniref:SAP domain-containing ribonucleoprotein-like n=1 Tax=Argopecten irradians TaxID=31199 RepID=UPI0037140BD2